MPRTELAHPAIDAVLSTAATLLGMEVVFIGGLTEDAFTFERVHADAEGWELPNEGSVLDRAGTLCHRLLAGAPSATADAANDPVYRDAAARSMFGITSYVGVPIRDSSGHVVATLCGVDRDHVPVDEETVSVLRQLADVVSAHLGPLVEEGVVIRRASEGGWAVGGDTTGDLTSAMVLADLLAGELQTGARPAKTEQPLDEVAQLRLSVKQLEHALAARVVVEQAIGVLTERQSSSPREAFERLRKVSRSRGRKVHDLAKEVVLSATDAAVPLPPELAGRR
ncbi:MAG: GAF and ANTAR domain-containing protein [Actinobacteria bacterium]|nr:GAF and ANTAR domain-containing protein [Actinomycetota bacterium]MCA1720997.1 GAF and ANTAR domain-containing protein [Actinomycetota bacterium]